MIINKAAPIMPCKDTEWGDFIPFGMKSIQLLIRDCHYNPVTGERIVSLTTGDFVQQDCFTERLYWHQDSFVLRIKHLALALFGQIVQTIALVANAMHRITRLLSGKSRNWKKDLLKVLATPFTFIGLWIASVYGILSPYNGQKVYAAIERAQFGSLTNKFRNRYNLSTGCHECTLREGGISALGVFGWRMAPCFQPGATRHGLSSADPQTNPNAF